MGRELSGYIGTRLRGNCQISVCVQGRHGTPRELERTTRCLDHLLASEWWPSGEVTTALHVASLSSGFRNKISRRYATHPHVRIKVHWPRWDEVITKEAWVESSFKSSLLSGSCHVSVVENGGSTFTYVSTAMFHSVALRDVGNNNHKANCENIRAFRYEELFPDARDGVDGRCYGKDRAL